MSLTETRTKLLSGSEVCPPGSLPSSDYGLITLIGRWQHFMKQTNQNLIIPLT
jgi:hypothetical protein